MIKRDIWKPMQKAMYNKESTTELETHEVSKIYEQLAKILGEKFNVEINFPSADEINKVQSYEKNRI